MRAYTCVCVCLNLYRHACGWGWMDAHVQRRQSDSTTRINAYRCYRLKLSPTPEGYQERRAIKREGYQEKRAIEGY